MCPSPLDDIRNSLVRSWGEMSGYWGINRTMAEIHALLFISTEPLCTDDVMQKLQISRGNASMNLRGLVDWGLIRRFHRLGDRKEYYQADTDVWHMFETIMRERRRREVEPIVATIDRCMETLRRIDAEHADGSLAAQRGQADSGMIHTVTGEPLPVRAVLAESRRRLENLRDFLATVGGLFDLVLRFGPQTMQQVAKMYTGLLSQTANASPLSYQDDGATAAQMDENSKARGSNARGSLRSAPIGDRKLQPAVRRTADTPPKQAKPATRRRHERSRTR